MTTVQFIILALVIGLPTAFLQVYFRYLDRQRAKKSSLWLTWSSLQAELSQTLHHPHPAAQELDRLLEKLDTFTAAGISTITNKERERLIFLLRKKADDPKQSKEERIRAQYLLIAMPKAKEEQSMKYANK